MAVAILSYLAAVLTAVAVETFIGATDAGFLDLLEVWLADGSRFSGPWGRLVTSFSNLVPMAAVAIVLALDHVRHQPCVHTDAYSFRWGLWLAGLALSAACWLGAAVSLEIIMRGNDGVQNIVWNTTVTEVWPAYVGAAVVIVGFGTLAEEVVFRGALPMRLRDLGATPIFAMALSGVAFIAIHDLTSWMRLVQLALAALAFAWSAHRLGRLEFAAGSHMAWNLAIHGMHARSTELLAGTDPSFLSVYSNGEWAVLLVMACSPAALTELWVRLPRSMTVRRKIPSNR